MRRRNQSEEDEEGRGSSVEIADEGDKTEKFGGFKEAGPSIEPPACAWKRCFDAPKLPKEFKDFTPSGFWEVLRLLPLAYRIASYVCEEKDAHRTPIFDLRLPGLKPPERKADQGVPLGGIGSGSLTRSYQGEFNRSDIHPGYCRSETIQANQFSLRVARADGSVETCVLSVLPAPVSGGDLGAWTWGCLNKTSCTYYAIFPRAWYVYDEPLPGIRLVCCQFSPVIPHDYEISGMPVSVFRWSIENTSDEEIVASLLFTFENGGEAAVVVSPGDEMPTNESWIGSHVCGVTLHHYAKVPDTVMRPEYLDSPERWKCNCFNFIAGSALLVLAFLLLGTPTCIWLSTKFDPGLLWGLFSATVLILSLPAALLLGKTCGLMPCFRRPKRWHHVSTAHCIAAGNCGDDVRVSVCKSFFTSGPTPEDTLWDTFTRTGEICDYVVPYQEDIHKYRRTGAGVCQQVHLKSQQRRELRFSLAWAAPLVHFGGENMVIRRYAVGFLSAGQVGSEIKVAEKIARVLAQKALHSWQSWNLRICESQRHILCDESLPTWYKSQLFNELYFLVAGGAVWFHKLGARMRKRNGITGDDGKDGGLEWGGYRWPNSKSANTLVKMQLSVSKQEVLPSSRQRTSDSEKSIGHFLYLEGQEYFMYNTADVHFYASFALAMLWPDIELSIQRDFANSVLQEDLQRRVLLGDETVAPRKKYGVIPHDFGTPSGSPLVRLNAYNFQDVSRWKDLGSKFVLQVLRDYVVTGDKDFLCEVYPAVKIVIGEMKSFDRDGDGVIENDGYPDQTYDVWTASGPSAYSGGLWLGSLSAGMQIARIMDDKITVQEYSKMFSRGRAKFDELLWDHSGRYYRYDASSSGHNDSIMADQLAGHWYSRACGLAGIVPAWKAKAALETIFRSNVMGFRGGAAGAVNGTRPGGTVDACCLQSQEVWSGTTYALAACMLQESRITHIPGRSSIVSTNEEKEKGSRTSLRDMAFHTAKGVQQSAWDSFGYFFQTPEAWNSAGNYRSLGYMRPLCIWAMQWSLQVLPAIEVGDQKREDI